MAVTPDGIAVSNRVDTTTERKLNAKVVDTILNSRTYASRLLGMGKPMMGKTYDYTVKVIDSQSGEFFTGLETLNSAASDTTVTMSFAHTAFQQPAVSIMLDSFANSGDEGTIDLDEYKLDEAVVEAVQKWGHAVYGTGAANQPLGLEAIVDDGTNNSTIGGQSRTTYTVLKANVTAATNGVLSLSFLASIEDAIVAAGLETEEPNINDTTKSIWTLYESLLTPTMRADYQSSGYNAIALRGNDIMKPAQLKGAAGFTALSYRGKPVIKDDDAKSQTWYMLNERYFEWRGRTIVPPKYRNFLQKVSLGAAKTMDGVAGSAQYTPPSSVGWFNQPYMMLPQQAGMIARYYCIGQVCTSQPRRQGKGTGITTV